MFVRLGCAIAALVLAGCQTASAQSEDDQQAAEIRNFAETCKPWDNWDKPTPPFRIFGSTFYVGTCGISAILIAAPEGSVLIDSGTEAGADTVLANLAKLGFEPGDLAFILHSHEHYDHVGGHAKIVEAGQIPGFGGPRVVATRVSAKVFETGVVDPSDPQAGMHDPMTPVPTSRIVADGDRVETKFVSLRAIETPGHTPGALSWQWQSCERNRGCKSLVYADSLSPVSSDSYRFSDHPDYLAAYRAGLDRIAALECDILLTPHPSASFMLQRAQSGSMVGGMTCVEYAQAVSRRLDARLERETGANQ